MKEMTTMVGALIVTAVVVIATKVFSRSCSPDSSDGDVPVISDTSSSSSSKTWKYDVFLSFRGEDTRKNYVDHLYTALKQRAFTYKDDVTLRRGDIIGPTLKEAIEESQILVIIFSENYGDSSWCLDELSHIMKCRDNERGQIVFPIFYNVEPSDIRNQKGKFGKAFAKHKKNNKVETWKKALVDATNTAGWDSKHIANGHEAEGIKQIVDSIIEKLQTLSDSAVDDGDLVGMGARLKELKSHLRIGSGGVLMVGIWGLGGGGKTTLANSLYSDLKSSGHFDGCSFVENVREESGKPNGLKSLQEKVLSTIFNTKMELESVALGKDTIKRMLSRRNVLIVLDDVNHLDQLEALVGRHDWFGDRSRIIITTRDQHLLISHRVDEVYEVNLLSRNEAIRLFRKHAYHENNHVEDFNEISLRVISYANGLPLAIKILGCFLCGRDKDEWLSTLARLKDHPNKNILETLKISYDGLDDVEKEIFLDIACFHRGEKMKDAMEILDACGFHPHIGVKVLIQKSLITISKDGEFDMHDLIEEMGQYIVRGEHPNNPEKHSRVWRYQDIDDMCSRNAKEENDKIEGLQYYRDGYSSFNMLVSNMKKLRFLQVLSIKSNDDGEPSFLSNELKYLDWSHYPASPFPESFQPKKLVVLKMNESRQKALWNGGKYLPCLKELNLSGMRALVTTPDFGGLPCLQKLTLLECESLEEIHQSLGNNSSLVSVQVKSCEKLTCFPSIVRMEKLEILEIRWCEALVEFPKIKAKLDNLKNLSLKGVGIEVLPSSVGEYCTNLISLQLDGCTNLKSIEVSFDALKCLEYFRFTSRMEYLWSNGVGFLSQLSRSLRKLDLSKRGLKDGQMPKEFGELSNLQELYLEVNYFTRLDFCLLKLTRLKLLLLNSCRNLVELPELPSSLAILRANDCYSLDVIRDEIHTNCKCLSKVSIKQGIKTKMNIKGGERLLETMLQGNDVESGCMSLNLRGSEIPRGFEPRLVKGKRCRMQVPDNWCNDFSGFLLCAFYTVHHGGTITMKHVEKLEGDSQHDNDVVYWDEDEETDVARYRNTWMGYISFDSLSHTTWWDPTSTSIQIEISDDNKTIGWGWKLVPKRGGGETSGQIETHSSSQISFHDDDYYKSKLYITHDSKSALKCQIYP